MTLPTTGLSPYRELVRRIEGLSGRVPLAWKLEPRPEYGTAPMRLARRAGVATTSRGRDALALLSFDAGEPDPRLDVDVAPFDASHQPDEVRWTAAKITIGL